MATHKTPLTTLGRIGATCALMFGTLMSASPAGAGSEVLGYSASARGNLLYVGQNIPLPVLALGSPGATSELSGEPASHGLGMAVDPGFVGNFTYEESTRGSGLPQTGAACVNPEGAIPTEQYWPEGEGPADTQAEEGPDASGPMAHAVCPSPHEARTLVRFGKTAIPAGDHSVTVSSGRSFTSVARRADGAFESVGETVLQDIVIGPLKIRRLEYRARALATGQPGTAEAVRTAVINGAEVNGQLISDPISLESGDSALDQINAALENTGISLSLAGKKPLATPDGATAAVTATSLIVRVASPHANAGGYTASSVVYLGRSTACVRLSVAGGTRTSNVTCVLGDA